MYNIYIIKVNLKVKTNEWNITYKNLDWYVMQEINKEKLIILKECFTKEQALKYFSPELVSQSGGVPFNKDINKNWWEDSIVREGLNSFFINDLDKSELNIMRTTLIQNGKEQIIEDYIRLITTEEVIKLYKTKKVILGTQKDWYWTMNPYGTGGRDGGVYFVYGNGYTGNLGRVCANITVPGIRPVISLKSDIITSKKIEEEYIKDNEEQLEEVKKKLKILLN